METSLRAAERLRLALLGVFLAGCAGSPTSDSAVPSTTGASVRQVLANDMNQCSGRTGYVPAKVAADDNRLAPNELQWRRCMYDALSTYAKASPAVAPQIQALIDGDIAMTAAVNGGTMTRNARKAQLQQLVAQVEAAEARAASAQQQQSEEYVNTISAIRALGR